MHMHTAHAGTHAGTLAHLHLFPLSCFLALLASHFKVAPTLWMPRAPGSAVQPHAGNGPHTIAQQLATLPSRTGIVTHNEQVNPYVVSMS